MSDQNQMPEWAKQLQKQQEELLSKVEEIKTGKPVKPTEEKEKPKDKPKPAIAKADIDKWAKDIEGGKHIPPTY